MPYRHIEWPEVDPIIFRDPVTSEEMEDPGPLSFRAFVVGLLDNPLFIEKYSHIRYAGDIMVALDEVASGKSDFVVLPEDAWLKLRESLETPKSVRRTAMGDLPVNGLPYRPSLGPQLLAFITPIMEARQVSAREIARREDEASADSLRRAGL